MKLFNSLQAPEWFIQEYDVLSKIPPSAMHPILEALLQSLLQQDQHSQTLLQEQLHQFTLTQSNAAIVCLEFIALNAARLNLKAETLCQDLVDLGLPQENCLALCSAYKQEIKTISSLIQKKVFSFNQIEESQVSQHVDLTNNCSFSLLRVKGQTYRLDEAQRQDLLQQLLRVKEVLAQDKA